MPSAPVKWGWYEPDHEGINDLARSPGMATAMMNIADEGVPMAKAMAPRKSNEYANSIHSEPMGVQAGTFKEFRAGAAIVADVEHAMAVEYLYGGSGHHTLHNVAVALQMKYGSRSRRGGAI